MFRASLTDKQFAVWLSFVRTPILDALRHTSRKPISSHLILPGQDYIYWCFTFGHRCRAGEPTYIHTDDTTDSFQSPASTSIQKYEKKPIISASRVGRSTRVNTVYPRIVPHFRSTSTWKIYHLALEPPTSWTTKRRYNTNPFLSPDHSDEAWVTMPSVILA